MAFRKKINDLSGLIILVVLTLPLIAANIDCNGKPFHCVNTTHFMICVDLGSGISSTIDDFVIPCPPTTVCKGTNHFECEFPTVTIATTVASTSQDRTASVRIETYEVTTSIPFEEYYDTVSTTTTFENLLTQQTIGTEPVSEVTENINVITLRSESNSTLIETTKIVTETVLNDLITHTPSNNGFSDVSTKSDVTEKSTVVIIESRSNSSLENNVSSTVAALHNYSNPIYNFSTTAFPALLIDTDNVTVGKNNSSTNGTAQNDPNPINKLSTSLFPTITLDTGNETISTVEKNTSSTIDELQNDSNLIITSGTTVLPAITLDTDNESIMTLGKNIASTMAVLQNDPDPSNTLSTVVLPTIELELDTTLHNIGNTIFSDIVTESIKNGVTDNTDEIISNYTTVSEDLIQDTDRTQDKTEKATLVIIESRPNSSLENNVSSSVAVLHNYPNPFYNSSTTAFPAIIIDTDNVTVGKNNSSTNATAQNDPNHINTLRTTVLPAITLDTGNESMMTLDKNISSTMAALESDLDSINTLSTAVLPAIALRLDTALHTINNTIFSDKVAGIVTESIKNGVTYNTDVIVSDYTTVSQDLIQDTNSTQEYDLTQYNHGNIFSSTDALLTIFNETNKLAKIESKVNKTFSDDVPAFSVDVVTSDVTTPSNTNNVNPSGVGVVKVITSENYTNTFHEITPNQTNITIKIYTNSRPDNTTIISQNKSESITAQFVEKTLESKQGSGVILPIEISTRSTDITERTSNFITKVPINGADYVSYSNFTNTTLESNKFNNMTITDDASFNANTSGDTSNTKTDFPNETETIKTQYIETTAKSYQEPATISLSGINTQGSTPNSILQRKIHDSDIHDNSLGTLNMRKGNMINIASLTDYELQSANTRDANLNINIFPDKTIDVTENITRSTTAPSIETTSESYREPVTILPSETATQSSENNGIHFIETTPKPILQRSLNGTASPKEIMAPSTEKINEIYGETAIISAIETITAPITVDIFNTNSNFDNTPIVTANTTESIMNPYESYQKPTKSPFNVANSNSGNDIDIIKVISNPVLQSVTVQKHETDSATSSNMHHYSDTESISDHVKVNNQTDDKLLLNQNDQWNITTDNTASSEKHFNIQSKHLFTVINPVYPKSITKLSQDISNTEPETSSNSRIPVFSTTTEVAPSIPHTDIGLSTTLNNNNQKSNSEITENTAHKNDFVQIALSSNQTKKISDSKLVASLKLKSSPTTEKPAVLNKVDQIIHSEKVNTTKPFENTRLIIQNSQAVSTTQTIDITKYVPITIENGNFPTNQMKSAVTIIDTTDNPSTSELNSKVVSTSLVSVTESAYSSPIELPNTINTTAIRSSTTQDILKNVTVTKSDNTKSDTETYSVENIVHITNISDDNVTLPPILNTNSNSVRRYAKKSTLINPITEGLPQINEESAVSTFELSQPTDRSLFLDNLHEEIQTTSNLIANITTNRPVTDRLELNLSSTGNQNISIISDKQPLNVDSVDTKFILTQTTVGYLLLDSLQPETQTLPYVISNRKTSHPPMDKPELNLSSDSNRYILNLTNSTINETLIEHETSVRQTNALIKPNHAVDIPRANLLPTNNIQKSIPDISSALDSQPSAAHTLFYNSKAVSNANVSSDVTKTNSEAVSETWRATVVTEPFTTSISSILKNMKPLVIPNKTTQPTDTIIKTLNQRNSGDAPSALDVEIINVPKQAINQKTAPVTTTILSAGKLDADIIMLDVKPIHASTQSWTSVISKPTENEQPEGDDDDNETLETKHDQIFGKISEALDLNIAGQNKVTTPTNKLSSNSNQNTSLRSKETAADITLPRIRLNTTIELTTRKMEENFETQSKANIEQVSIATSTQKDLTGQDQTTSFNQNARVHADIANNETSTLNVDKGPVRYIPQKKLANKHNNVPASNSAKVNLTNYICESNVRGRFSDSKDCRKFYICIGRPEPIEGICPNNTVFSELWKQCTKNLSHCVRNHQFQCMSEGRFSDYLKDNIYYICVKNNKESFIRFRLQCQSGYHLNKTSVRCELNTEMNYSTSQQSTSDQSVSSAKSEKLVAKSSGFECKKEGKFPDTNECRTYYVCYKRGKSQYRQKRKQCDSDEIFHKDKKRCVDADSYDCN